MGFNSGLKGLNQRVTFFKRKAGGGRFFKEVGKDIPDYTALYPGR